MDENCLAYGIEISDDYWEKTLFLVQSAIQDLFGISMSLGTVNNLRLEASNAVESAIEEAKIYIQNSPVVGADETHFGSAFIARMLTVVTTRERLNVEMFWIL